MAEAGTAFGDRLVELRGRRTQREIGEAVGVSASAVGQWENGITTPRRETVFALEDLFECPGELATLLGYGRPVTNGTRRAPAKAARSEDRLENLEVRLDRLEAKVDQLLDRYPPAEGSR